MFDLSILDEEEIILLVGSCFSLLYTTSFAFSLVKLYRKKFTYDVFPIISLFFCFLNGLMWAQYSDLIYHESMKLIFQISVVIAGIYVALFSLYEILKDIVDTILNVLILVTSTWAVKKLIDDILKEEEKVKMTCAYAIGILYLSSLEWAYRSYAEKNTNILNFLSGFFMFSSAICWVYYGYKYEDKYFLFSNLVGILGGCIYIFVWNKTKKKYGYKVPIKVEKKDDKKKEKKETLIKEEIKENKENKDEIKENKEIKEDKNKVEIVEEKVEKIVEEKDKKE